MEKDRSEEKRKGGVMRFSVATAAGLTVMKLAVGLASHSVAVLASAADSLMDVLVSTVNYISLREAQKPADADHAYGHGKIESLAGLFQSLLISASGVYLIVESIRRLLRGETLSHIPVSVAVMAVSMVATFFLVRKLRSVAASTGSVIVGTEVLHFTTDILTNGGVIAALLLVRWTGWVVWDLVTAIAISVYILTQAVRILKTSIDELIDRALPENVQGEIKHIITHFDRRIIGFHNFRTRKIGATKFVDFHVEMHKEMSFQEAHDLTEALIVKIRERFHGTDVTAHFDPEGGV